MTRAPPRTRHGDARAGAQVGGGAALHDPADIDQLTIDLLAGLAVKAIRGYQLSAGRPLALSISVGRTLSLNHLVTGRRLLSQVREELDQ